MAFVTGAKYNYMRDEQRKAELRELLPLLPGQPSPQLPALESPPDATQPDAPAGNK
jgi:hypothetical protein